MGCAMLFFLLWCFRSGNCLENADLPAIFSDGHQNLVLLSYLLGVDDLAAVEDLLLQLCGIAQLHGGAFGGVEDSVELVPMIDKADAHAVFLLSGDLIGDDVTSRADKNLVELVRTIVCQSLSHDLPRIRISARDGSLR